MTFEANIKLRHTDPEVLAGDIAALTTLLERRHNDRLDAATPSAEKALRAAERLLDH